MHSPSVCCSVLSHFFLTFQPLVPKTLLPAVLRSLWGCSAHPACPGPGTVSTLPQGSPAQPGQDCSLTETCPPATTSELQGQRPLGIHRGSRELLTFTTYLSPSSLLCSSLRLCTGESLGWLSPSLTRLPHPPLQPSLALLSALRGAAPLAVWKLLAGPAGLVASICSDATPDHPLGAGRACFQYCAEAKNSAGSQNHAPYQGDGHVRPDGAPFPRL